jgi:hypothetical protein
LKRTYRHKANCVGSKNNPNTSVYSVDTQETCAYLVAGCSSNFVWLILIQKVSRSAFRGCLSSMFHFCDCISFCRAPILPWCLHHACYCRNRSVPPKLCSHLWRFVCAGNAEQFVSPRSTTVCVIGKTQGS